MTDIDPITGLVANPVTQRWYDLLPEMFRTADASETSADHPLWAYMDAVCSVLVEPTRIADRIADGQLTDPAVADDAWIPWLSQAVGIYASGPALQRERLANIITSPAVGSRSYLEGIAQGLLTGTHSVTVSAIDNFGIQFQVRADELDLVGGTTDGLVAALYATGRIPSGFTVVVTAASETWAQVGAVMGTWAAGEGKTWGRIGSMGLLGGGYTSGSFLFGGFAAGGQLGNGFVAGAVTFGGGLLIGGVIAGGATAGSVRWGGGAVAGVATTVGTPSVGRPHQMLPSGFNIGTTAYKPVFFHYFAPYPISIDNSGNPMTDYWHNNWLTAALESGTIDHRPYGGQTRNRPMPRPPQVGVSPLWKRRDAEDEIRLMQEIGGDGWYVDLMSFTGENYLRYQYMRDAANAIAPDGTIKIVPMFDCNGSGVFSATADQLADQIAAFTFSNPTPNLGGGYIPLPSAYILPDGRIAVATFKSENKTLAQWQAMEASLLSRYGMTMFFINIMLSWTTNATYAPVADAWGVWGDGADPALVDSYTAKAALAHSRGNKWSAPIWAQYIVPHAGQGDEAKNFRCLTASWNQAIADQADMAQCGTWNDFSEEGEFCNSTNSGKTLLDISSYYWYKMKTGAFPPILRDVVYLSHRNQLFTGNTFRNPQTIFITQKTGRNGPSVMANDVEVLTFLTAPADITVTIGGVAHTYTAPAGVSSNATWPLTLGTVSVVAKRSGVTFKTLTSPVVVTNNPYNQGIHYYHFSSERTTAGQYDATNV